MNRSLNLIVPLSIAVVVLVGILYFSKSPGESAAGATSAPPVATAATHSDATPHAPSMQSFGDYHIDGQVSDTGKVELDFYAGKASELMPISTTTADMMEARIIVPGEDAIPVTLTAHPYPGEPSGQSSRFVGEFRRRPDQAQVGMTLTLPYEQKTYRINWSPQSLQFGATGGHGDVAMPAAVATDEAKKLFLTPGGLYTQSDIIANGNTTASEKYVGLMAAHNMNPAPGSPICPVTNTAADQRFAWIIGGKKYLFCCPPCIEEFVKKAKQKPEAVLPPEDYVKK